MDLKKLIVGTPIGNLAYAARDVWHYLSVPKEQADMLTNDQLAAHYVTRICLPHKIFVDVGAHIGSVSSEVLRNCPTARLIAIEAIPAKAEHLRRKFPSAEVHNCAVSEQEGEVSFYVCDEHSAFSSLSAETKGGRAITIRSARLDEIVKTDVDVVKIDVEGAELGVLMGADELLKSCRPTIMFESGPSDCLGYTKKAMFELFAGRCYELFVPNRLPHKGAPLTLESFIDAHCYPFRSLNYFAVAAERVPEIRAQASRFPFSRW